MHIRFFYLMLVKIRPDFEPIQKYKILQKIQQRRSHHQQWYAFLPTGQYHICMHFDSIIGLSIIKISTIRLPLISTCKKFIMLPWCTSALYCIWLWVSIIPGPITLSVQTTLLSDTSQDSPTQEIRPVAESYTTKPACGPSVIIKSLLTMHIWLNCQLWILHKRALQALLSKNSTDSMISSTGSLDGSMTTDVSSSLIFVDVSVVLDLQAIKRSGNINKKSS